MGGRKGIAKITPEIVELMQRYYAQGYTQKEIATFLGIDVSTVQRSLGVRK